MKFITIKIVANRNSIYFQLSKVAVHRLTSTVWQADVNCQVKISKNDFRNAQKEENAKWKF